MAITGYDVLQDTKTIKDMKTNITKNSNDIKVANEQLGEMENKKINYTDLTPITTTGTSSDYVATIPTNIAEVTIVPHVNNISGATLNSIPILDREGKPIGKDTLIANIPTKLVRVGNSFFLASGGKIKGASILDKYGRPRERMIFSISVPSYSLFLLAYGASKEVEAYIYNITDTTVNYVINKKGCRVFTSNYTSLGVTGFCVPLFFSEYNEYFYGAVSKNNRVHLITINTNPPYDLRLIDLTNIADMANMKPNNMIIGKDGKLYVWGKPSTTTTTSIKIGRYSPNLDGGVTTELENLNCAVPQTTYAKSFYERNGRLFIEGRGSSSYSDFYRAEISMDTLTHLETIKHNGTDPNTNNNSKENLVSYDGTFYFERSSTSSILKKSVTDDAVISTINLSSGTFKSNDILNKDSFKFDIAYHDGLIKCTVNNELYLFGRIQGTNSVVLPCIFKISSNFIEFEVIGIRNSNEAPLVTRCMANAEGGFSILGTETSGVSQQVTTLCPSVVSID